MILIWIVFGAASAFAQDQAASAAEPTLAGVIIEGNTVYRQQQLLDSYLAFLGAAVTPDTVRQIARAIRQRYRDDGYRLAQVAIPSQQVAFGIVRFRIYEGSVEQIDLAGNTDPALRRLVEEKLVPLRQGQPFNTRVYRHVLRQVNALPGVRARGDFERLENGNGRYRLTLDLDHRRWQGFVRVDNRGSERIGPVRILSGLDINSPFGYGERFRLRLGTAESTEELRYLSLRSDWPLASDGTQLSLSGAVTEATPGVILNEPNSEIERQKFTIGVRKPVFNSAAHRLDAEAKLEASASEARQRGRLLRDDQLRIASLGAHYRWYQDNRAYGRVSGVLDQGLDALGAELETAPGAANSDRELNFTRFTLGWYYRLPFGSGSAVMFRGDGQYSDDILPASERLLFGGRRYGRGYDPAEISGDSGVVAQLELSHRFDLDPVEPTLYGFYDAGVTWRNRRGESRWRRSAAAAGVGVELDLNLGATSGNAFVEMAKPLTREVESEGNKDPRLFAGFRLGF